MDLSRMTATARPRSPWESIDLGFALARTWFLPLWLCWWLTAAPLALAALVPLHRHPDLWLLLVWWCKPAFEALPLHWLSRALFGEQLALPAAARSLPRALPPRLWPQLLWRRIGMGRSFNMAVTLLEAPRGGARGQRLRVLRTGAAGWLTLVCVHLEAILWLSGLLLLAFLVPEGLPTPDLEAAIFDTGSAPYWIASLGMVLAMSVIAPCYVAAGFALYLGRRTELEAWDLELAFRRARATRRTGRLRPGSTAVLLLAVLLPASGTATTMTSDEAEARIEAVLAHPDFGGTREAQVWVYVGDDDAQPDEPRVQAQLPAWLIQALAEGMKWLLLIAAAVALALLALPLVRDLAAGRRQHSAPAEQPGAQVAPAEADAGPPPADLPAAVRRLLAAGDVRAALALLYREQLRHLRAAGVELPDSATEQDCLRAARRLGEPRRLAYLEQVVGAWQAVAYGHRPLEPAAVTALLQDQDTFAPAGGRG
ncbi:DUF4129 domain-containing protein [uncultured Thiohalocapsa sp.]|uniref:DUF4129 domain-containing protein n=1 Tax=uncultured Thiohalocapsa sp. TaxID=768990 RepID=UPI0025EE5F70|nr:DUF4129 domain-containing protein [uncultured Thiohalocapsa sp.]